MLKNRDYFSPRRFECVSCGSGFRSGSSFPFCPILVICRICIFERPLMIPSTLSLSRDIVAPAGRIDHALS